MSGQAKADRRGDCCDRQPRKHVDRVVISRIHTGDAESSRNQSEPERRPSAGGIQAECHRPCTRDVGAWETSSRNRRARDDQFDGAGEHPAAKRTQTRHDLGVFPRPPRGEERIPHIGEEETEHHARHRRVKPASWCSAAPAVSFPGDDDPANDQEYMDEK